MLTQSEYISLLRNDLMLFIERCFYELHPETPFMPAPYIELMATKLIDCWSSKTKRLIINVPPRTLKSHCASIAFVAFVLGQDPSKKFICASYGAELSQKMARDCRTIMNTDWYKALFGQILADRQVVHDFMTIAKGFRMATSVGGVLTGRGADFIIIDDPQKPDDAMSETGRKSVNDWFDGSVRSRLDSRAKGCIIIIMQRLHQDDLCGHVLEQGEWDVLSLPLIADADEEFVISTPYGKKLYRRKTGELLHPARDTLVSVEKIQSEIGIYKFESQYQQNPMPEGGAIVKHEWLRFYEPGELPSRFDRIVQSWDTANKASELADFSVCTIWGERGESVYLLDVFRKRLEYPDLKRKVEELAGRYRRSTILIEDHASGTQLIQELRNPLFGIIARSPAPGGDKQMRLRNQTTWFESGKVFLPRDAPWLPDYITELTGFPGSRHDDQVDSTTQALAYLGEDDGMAIWIKLGEASRRERGLPPWN